MLVSLTWAAVSQIDVLLRYDIYCYGQREPTGACLRLGAVGARNGASTMAVYETMMQPIGWCA
ncbi:MAG: hypothetical protein R6W76_11555 [Caldilinea sp.]